MIRYATIINVETGLCSVGLGTNEDFYKSAGMTEQDVEQSEVDKQWYLADKCPHYTEEEKAKKEQEVIDRLTMTPLDFIKVLEASGLTLEQINAFLESNLNVKMQLTYCNSVYCGVAKSFMPVTVGDITITADMVEQAFKVKNGIAAKEETTETVATEEEQQTGGEPENDNTEDTPAVADEEESNENTTTDDDTTTDVHDEVDTADDTTTAEQTDTDTDTTGQSEDVEDTRSGD